MHFTGSKGSIYFSTKDCVMDAKELIFVLLFRSLLKVEQSFDSKYGQGKVKEELNGWHHEEMSYQN